MAWLQHNSYVVNQYNLICIINIELLSKDTYTFTKHRFMSSCPSFTSEASINCKNLSYGKKRSLTMGIIGYIVDGFTYFIVMLHLMSAD